MLTQTDTPLGRTIAETATDIWNDSCNVAELEYAVSFGAEFRRAPLPLAEPLVFNGMRWL